MTTSEHSCHLAAENLLFHQITFLRNFQKSLRNIYIFLRSTLVIQVLRKLLLCAKMNFDNPFRMVKWTKFMGSI
jgi:hypothetical protein